MPHYWEAPETPLKLKKFSTRIRGFELMFYTAPGVFSKKRVDFGTRLLAETMIVEPGWKVLDMGCGYGVLGIIAAKLGAEAYLVDLNPRAVYLAKLNAKENGVSVRVFKGNLYEPVKHIKFDSVVTNPPMSAGKKVCFSIIDGAQDVLKNGGLLQLVARRRKGGESLAKRMEEVFGNVEVLAKKGGYWVWVSRKV